MNSDRQEVTSRLHRPTFSAASFWSPDYLMASTWLEHAPFAFWLMDALRPHRVVEVGTQNGFSLLAFCQAGKGLGIGCACYGVGQWKDVEGNFPKGDNAYQRLAGVIEINYSSMAELRNLPPTDAAPYFSDSSIDLLHLTDQGPYEQVQETYQKWLPKISASGIVIIHGINLHDQHSGAWRLWAELKDQHPSFEFIHGGGLGVLAVGSDTIGPLAALMRASKSEIDLIRAMYGRLGHSIAVQQAADSKIKAAIESEARTVSILKKREHELALRIIHQNELEALKRNETRLQSEIIDALNQRSAAVEVIDDLRAAMSQLDRKVTAREAELARQRVATEMESQSRYALLASVAMATPYESFSIHPLTLFVARYSRLHPKRIRLIWAALKGTRLFLTLRWVSLVKAVMSRVR